MESISVIVPLYNKAPYISQTINLILRQTKLPAEVIVIDDGSTDGGGDLVDLLQNPLIRLIRQKNKGVGAARNSGIALAKGDLIAFLDADDEWKPTFLEVIYDMRKYFPQAGAYATAFDIIESKGRKNNNKISSKNLSLTGRYCLVENLFAVGVKPPLLWTSATVIPKKIFNKVGYFNEDVCLGEDIDMWIRIGIYYPIVWNCNKFATYRHDTINRYSKKINILKEPSFSVTISNAVDSGIVDPIKIKDFREYGSYYQYWAVRQLIINNKKNIALSILNKTKGTKRFYRQGWMLLIFIYLPSTCLKYAIHFYRILFVDTKEIFYKIWEKLHINGS